MFGLLIIFGQIRGEPCYGHNSGVIQGLTTGAHYVKLAGSNLLSVPRPIATQIERRATLDLVDKPQRACRRQDQTERVGADDALPLPALILPQPIESIGVADFNFHRPAVAILVQDVLGAQSQISGEKGFDGWGWFSLPRPF